MINLIYGSAAVKPMSTEELVELLHKARIKNQSLNITGMLLYKGGNFLQVLEGEEKVVRELYAVIEKDPRHHSVELIAVRSVKERMFSDWEMGFTNLDTEKNINVPGYTEYLQEPLNSKRFRDASFAYTFLQVFKENVR